MKKKPEDDIEFLSQPFLTDEGFVNPACMNELEAAFKNMPKDYDRLADDPEWYTKKDMWTFRDYIVGAFAKWACRQSPYGCPEHLTEVCGYLNESLKTYFKWETRGMEELSLCEISKALHDILMDQNITYFDQWNKSKKGKPSNITFTCSQEGSMDPDYDFIDLYALLRNVCIDIRQERRAERIFDRGFEQDWAETWPIDYQI